MTKREENCITIELFWQHLMPEILVPKRNYLLMWLRHYSPENITAEIEKVARYVIPRNITGTDHVGRIVSKNLRTKYGNDEDVRTLHFSA
jgi:hypothetical protein